MHEMPTEADRALNRVNVLDFAALHQFNEDRVLSTTPSRCTRFHRTPRPHPYLT